MLTIKARFGRGFAARTFIQSKRVQSKLSRIPVLGLVGMLAACGGGGGGGGSGGSGGSSPPPLVYTGNTNPAMITTKNAAVLTANIFGGSDASSALTSAAAAGGDIGVRDTGRRLTTAVHRVPLRSASGSRRLSSEPIAPVVQSCDNGIGTVRTAGDLNVSGTGTLSITWTNCLSGSDTLDGAATLQVIAFEPDLGPDGTIIDGMFTFQRVSLTTPNGTGIVSGTVRSQIDVTQSSEVTTSNLITLDISSGKMTMTQDYKVSDFVDDLLSPTAIILSETITGRLYDGTHGFVDIVTTVNAPLVFDSADQRFPRSGELVLTGAVGRHIRATSQSPSALTLALDLQGNGTEQKTVILAWTDLGRPAGSDLDDDDGDGMHNSWERAYGLNPNLNDKDGDLDGDGATNLAEYLAGTNPNDANSKPATVTPPAASAGGGTSP